MTDFCTTPVGKQAFMEHNSKGKLPGKGGAEEEEASSSSSSAVATDLTRENEQEAKRQADAVILAVAMANAPAFANSTQNASAMLPEKQLPPPPQPPPPLPAPDIPSEESKKEDSPRKMPLSPLVTPPFGSNAPPPGSPPPSTSSSRHNFTVEPEQLPIPLPPLSVPTTTTSPESTPRRQRLHLPPPIHANDTADAAAFNTAAAASSDAAAASAAAVLTKASQQQPPAGAGEETTTTARRGIPHVYHDYAHVSGPGPAYIRKKTGGVTQPFPEKLHEMLLSEAGGDNNPSAIVAWLPHGRGFIVRRPKEFTTEIMPKYVYDGACVSIIYTYTLPT
jgi:HSF-type DNA-binding